MLSFESVKIKIKKGLLASLETAQMKPASFKVWQPLVHVTRRHPPVLFLRTACRKARPKKGWIRSHQIGPCHPFKRSVPPHTSTHTHTEKMKLAVILMLVSTYKNCILGVILKTCIHSRCWGFWQSWAVPGQLRIMHWKRGRQGWWPSAWGQTTEEHSSQRSIQQGNLEFSIP